MTDLAPVVTHCHDCPALNTTWEGEARGVLEEEHSVYECNLGAAGSIPRDLTFWRDGKPPPPPDDCPLRKGPVTLRLKDD